MEPHRLAELRSIAYHRAVAERLTREPRLVEEARRRVAAALAAGGAAAPWHRLWLALLERPLDELCARLVEDSEEMRALRQSTPFAGVVDPRERWRIWRAVKAAAGRT